MMFARGIRDLVFDVEEWLALRLFQFSFLLVVVVESNLLLQLSIQPSASQDDKRDHSKATENYQQRQEGPFCRSLEPALVSMSSQRHSFPRPAYVLRECNHLV